MIYFSSDDGPAETVVASFGKPNSIEDLRTLNSNDQQLVLRYATDKDLRKILALWDSPKIPEMRDLIKSGEWQTFIKCFGKKRKDEYVLLATFSQNLITADELATAKAFISTRSRSERKVRVIQLTPEHYHCFQSPKLDEDASDEEKSVATAARIATLPLNQRFMLMVDLKTFTGCTDLAIKSTFEGRKVIGVRIYNLPEGKFVSVPSFGLAKTFYADFNDQCGFIAQKLVPALGLTPTLQEMAHHILSGYSDVAILSGDNVPIIHGSYSHTWGYLHDLLHIWARAQLGARGPALIEFAVKAKDKQVAEPNPNVTHEYGQPNPGFVAAPLRNEVLDFTIDRVCSELVDGTRIPGQETDIEFIEKVTHLEVNRIVQEILKKFAHIRFEMHAIAEDAMQFFTSIN